jgi:RNA polymerase sigma-70 factor, ECF subfamily
VGPLLVRVVTGPERKRALATTRRRCAAAGSVTNAWQPDNPVVMMGENRRVAFERMFAATYGEVRRYVGRRAPRAELEDVLSEVYLVAWRRFDSVAGDPLPWLYGIARRVLANQLRSERRRGALLDRLRHRGDSEDPGWVAPDGLRSALAAAIAALSPPEREALLLTVWEGLSSERGARAAGCSGSAFRVRLHRARRHLQAELAAQSPSRPSSSIPKGAS